MNRSETACRSSIKGLCPTGWAYLWTFTLATAEPWKVASGRYARLIMYLRRKQSFEYVRVFEDHPGGHGLHCHLVTSERIPVQLVRQMAAKCGVGRIHVKRIGASSAPYIAKYLTKGRVRVAGVRLRWWAVSQQAAGRTLCSDIVNLGTDSVTRIWRAMHANKVPWRYRRDVAAVAHVKYWTLDRAGMDRPQLVELNELGAESVTDFDEVRIRVAIKTAQIELALWESSQMVRA